MPFRIPLVGLRCPGWDTFGSRPSILPATKPSLPGFSCKFGGFRGFVEKVEHNFAPGPYKGVQQINDTENSDWFEAQAFLDPTGIETDATVEEPTEPEVTNDEPDNGSSYVEADGSNHRVWKFSADGEWVEPFAGSDKSGDLLDPADPLKTQLQFPCGVSVLPDGAVLITDTSNQRVLRVDKKGRVSVFAGTGRKGDSLTQLNDPTSTVVLPDGSVLIADTNNHRVLKVATDNQVSIFAGTGKQGSRVFTNSPTLTELVRPTSIGVLPDGTALIVDSVNSRVLGVSPESFWDCVVS